MRGNFSPARNVLSTVEPVSMFLSLVRITAPPLPGLWCWNHTMRQTWPSSWMCMPFLNWLVSTTSDTRIPPVGSANFYCRRLPHRAATGRGSGLHELLGEARQHVVAVLGD